MKLSARNRLSGTVRSATGIELRTDVPSEVIIILQGILILSIVVAFELVRRLAARRRLQETHERA